MCISVTPPNNGDADWIEKLVMSPALVREIEGENLRGPKVGGRLADAQRHLGIL